MVGLGRGLGDGNIFRRRGGAAGQGEQYELLTRPEQCGSVPSLAAGDIGFEIAVIRQRERDDVIGVAFDALKMVLTTEIAGGVGPQDAQEKVILDLAALGQEFVKLTELSSGAEAGSPGDELVD